MADMTNSKVFLGSVPVENPDDEARRAAYGSHSMNSWDPDERPECDRCQCKAGSLSASWPCGDPIPRTTVWQLGIRGYGVSVTWGEFGGVMFSGKRTFVAALRAKYELPAEMIPLATVKAEVAGIGWVQDQRDWWAYDGSVWNETDGWYQMVRAAA